jgi:hypothetical protein
VLACYDPFTIVSLMQIEDLGFCPKGEGGRFVEGTTLHFDGGRLPYNTHGGMLSHAYVLGIAHVVELVRQLRGEAAAQVPTRASRSTAATPDRRRARSSWCGREVPRRVPAARPRVGADPAVLGRRRAARARAAPLQLRAIRLVPRRHLPSCGGSIREWTPVSGRGRLFSWSIVHRAFIRSSRRSCRS